MPASLAADLRMALDPAALARTAGVDPDPWQAQVLRSDSSRLLLNCSRQSGKSTTVATLAVHTALYDAGALVLLVSPTLRQSGELFKKATTAYRALGRPVPAESESALQLALDNGSRIVSLPGKEGTIRGYSGVRLLAIDEAAWVPNDLYTALRPMLAVSQGRLIAMSTPHGTRGWWYEAWRSKDLWERIEVPAGEYWDLAVNAVTLEPGKVIMNAGAPTTVKALEKEGVEVIQVDFSESHKFAIAGLHCATMELVRDQL